MDVLNCPFEKTLLGGRFGCSRAERYCIAEREGMGCLDLDAFQGCKLLYAALHEAARFALKLRGDVMVLPHGQEMKVLFGGLLGLQQQLGEEGARVDDIAGLLARLLACYGVIEALPYSQITPSIVAYEHRRRRR